MRILLSVLLTTICSIVFAQGNDMCTNNPARAWWDVQEYVLDLKFEANSTAITGSCTIVSKVIAPAIDSMQIDLDEGLDIDRIIFQNTNILFRRSGQCYYVKGNFSGLKRSEPLELKIFYHGKIKEAKKAPWDGGMVLEHDAHGNPWMAIACQGEGASIWFPCKNFQGDEPERATMNYTVPEKLSAIGNGRLQKVSISSDPQFKTWTWQVQNPINNYDITFYIGNYIHWADTLNGANGKLSLDYYVLAENKKKAQKQFAVVKTMLQCFEEKMGPYPFYEDGYKLVDAPYLGMEHQSAIAYGNEYKMGYLGKDRSQTGAGLDFDFIIIHESGHEWFGNNITAFDKADTWIQEGFTSYSETIFEECLKGKARAFAYQQGKRRTIHNDRPVRGTFDACDEGSGDHYDKAGFMVHMIRMIMDDDTRFFAMLREMNKRYYHKIVTGKEIEQFINEYSGKDLSKIYDQYLGQASLPQLDIQFRKGATAYRWANCVPGFNMPILLLVDGRKQWITPNTNWQEIQLTAKNIEVDKNFLIDTKFSK